MPGVVGVSLGSFVPWRDAGSFGPAIQFAVEGHKPAPGEENPRARFRIAAPRFFPVLGIPIFSGRDFSDEDRADSEPVVIVSQSVAQQLFPNGEALNKMMWWTDPYFSQMRPRRIVGVVADTDDENVAQGPAMTIYHPVRQIGLAGRLFVRTAGDPYSLVPAVTRVARHLSRPAPERGATLGTRARASPDRLNARVLRIRRYCAADRRRRRGGCAGVSVSARTREFGVRLAVGSSPRLLIGRVLYEGLFIAAIGIGVGVGGGFAFERLARGFFENVQLPGVLPVMVAATVLIGAAGAASLMPAARAARVDVLQALRSNDDRSRFVSGPASRRRCCSASEIRRASWHPSGTHSFSAP